MNNKPTLITYHIDDITFQLKEAHDFQWLRDLGHVFTVFDQQDSGNISFGVESDGIRKFVKYAGAKTLAYEGDPEDAIVRLKQGVYLYEELRHPYLIEIFEHYEVESGYVAVFEWFDGECLHPHWSYPPPAKYSHPDSPYFKFRQLPVEQRLLSLDSIFTFHVFVEEKKYVAIDFYDGSILYDFENDVTKICDIDYYQRKPYINLMGRLWGSSRFMSPEEFELGAEINESTNVFNMGAVSFALLGGELDRSFTKWEAGKELYDVACRAIERNKSERYSSVEQFYGAWQAAGQRYFKDK